MTKPNSLLGACLAALLFTVACGLSQNAGTQAGLPAPERAPKPAVPAPAPAVAGEAIPRITVQALKDKMDKGADVTIVDVRTKAQFDQFHAARAVSIPLAELPQRYGELRREADIVAY